MAWRDRLRRRAAGADGSGAGQSGLSGSGDSSGSVPGASGDGGGTSGAGASGSSVPGDWDGGWRRTAPPPLTVARASLGVSDGLTFRAGLASWQNPSFDNGLGHALLPTAPTGVVSGVTRQAAPQPTRAGGGPLLLRAVRPEGADAGDLGGGGQGSGSSGSGSSGTTSRSAPSGAGPVVQRSADNSGAGQGRSADAPRTRGITSADSPAVLSSPAPAVQRAAEPGAPAVVTPADTGRSAGAPEIPLVRRVAVVPGATAGVPGPDSGSASRSPGGSGGRTTSGPAVQRAATESRPSDVAVQPRPVGPRLTVARRQAGPVRRVPALRPAAPDPRPAPDASAAPSAPAAGTTAPVQRAATRTGSRAPLGAPLSEMPSTATPLAEGRPAPHPASGTGSAPGPALPVVQRQTEGGGASDGGVQGAAQQSPAPRRTSDAGRSGARARGGLGAPLPALPPSAAVPGSTSSGAHASRGPDVQRAAGRQDGRGSATGPGRDRTSAETAPPASGPDVQRAPSRQDGRASATAPGRDRTPPASGPDIQRAPSRQDGPGSATVPGRDGTPAEAAPPAGGGSGTDAPLLGSVDVQRRVTNPSATGDTTSSGHPTAHGTGPATPLVTPPQATAPEGPAGAATPTTPAAPAGNAPRPGAQRPSTPGAPGPVVVARALAEGTPGADRPAAPAAPGGHGATGTGSASPSVQAAPGGHGATGTLGAADPRALAEGTPRADRPAAPAASRGHGAAGAGSASPSVQAAPGGHGATGTLGAADPRALPVTGSAASSVQAAPSTHGTPGPVVAARALAEGASDARTPGADRPTAPAAPRAGAPGAADSRSLPGAGSAAPSVPAAPSIHGAPGPVVVARALAEGAPAADRPTAPAAPRAARTPGAANARPLPVTGSPAPRTLQLLPARPLTLSTRAPKGAAQPTATRPGNRPVVPMRRPGDPAAPQSQGGTGTPAHPTPGPSSATPATPHVQRSATPGPAPQNSGARTTGSSTADQRVPVVQLAPPHRETHGAPAAVPARSLPITAPQTPPLADRPAATSAPGSAGNVPVVRPRTSAPGGGTRGAAPPVQRAYSADDSALPGSMDKTRPARPRQPASAAGDLAEPAKPQTGNGRSASAKRTAQRAEPPQDPGMDLDELARRLIDPVARLLRTELRRGRERTGRPYDGRR
ncbi:hypothetical protein OG828_24060 [Streptomyces sp. NBC_00457]|uniref:hypothetical protein n=1 Tax=Streptomyces sp. NBC_00457 TaxID=2975748 RepID=UPI002E1CE4C2